MPSAVLYVRGDRAEDDARLTAVVKHIAATERERFSALPPCSPAPVNTPPATTNALAAT